jgi:hypothetical protein
VQLDAQLDARLVRTFLLTLQALLQFRSRPHGLLLSELGGWLLSPAQAPAGTKRLSTLLHSPKWAADLLDRWLWQAATTRLTELEVATTPALLLWDESVLEKPETLTQPDFGPVRSSKAARLARIKPGYYRPPGRPVFVPGLQWAALLLIGLSGPPLLAAQRWWSTRGAHTSDKRTEETTLLRQAARAWKRRVLHVFDRGFAGTPWLEQLWGVNVRFVVRWPTRYHLQNAAGEERPAWQWTRGKRSAGQYQLWDTRRRCWRTIGVLAVEVRHPTAPGRRLWLVVSRPGKGLAPWYLLTNEPITTADAAWAVVRAYARRWQIEQMWRYCKSELSFESVRVWEWEDRRKLLMLASLVYAFLLSLLEEEMAGFRTWLLRNWGHRTGQRSRATAAPLYRLRAAISRLWATHPPPPPRTRCWAQSPG